MTNKYNGTINKIMKRKMKCIARYMVLFIGCLLTYKSSGQDPVFSQYYNMPLLLNPAMAGNTYAPIIHVHYRNQWPALGQIYTTYAASFDKFSEKYNSGLGLMILSDNAGDGILRSNILTGIYSYRLRIKNETYIKGGLSVGLGNQALDWSRFIFGDGIDPNLGPVSPGGSPFPSAEVAPQQDSRTFINVGSGIVLYSKYYYCGISLANMNSPDLSYLSSFTRQNAQLPMRFTLHGGTEYVLDEGNKSTFPTFISTQMLFTRQAGFNQFQGGVFMSIDKIQMGVAYRHAIANGDAVIAQLGFRQDYFKLSYSFDVTTSKLSISQGGSHEVGIILNFDTGKKRRPNYNDCFQIFR